MISKQANLACKAKKPAELTLMMLEPENSSFGVNTIPADALAPKVTSASAGMALVVKDRQHILSSCSILISSTWVNQNPRYVSRCEYIFDNF